MGAEEEIDGCTGVGGLIVRLVDGGSYEHLDVTEEETEA